MIKKMNEAIQASQATSVLSHRFDNEPAYVLMSQPWKETSLLVEVFTKNHGRFSLIARSARRPKSTLRGILMPFAPLSISWFGKELRTLHHAEWSYGIRQLTDLFLWSGFYMNELILRLTARDDPIAEVFELYDHTIKALAEKQDIERTLRDFELSLLGLFGYGPTLDKDDAGEVILPDQRYLCEPKALPKKVAQEQQQGLVCEGSVLLAILQRDFSSDITCRFAKRLTKSWIESLLPKGELLVRKILSGVGMIGE